MARAVRQEFQQWTHFDRSPASVGLLDLTAGPGRIKLMDAYHDAFLVPEPLREADVVRVAVRKHDAPHLIQRAAQLGQLPLQFTPVARQTSVDDRDPSGILNQVYVDDIRANPTADEVRASSRVTIPSLAARSVWIEVEP